MKNEIEILDDAGDLGTSEADPEPEADGGEEAGQETGQETGEETGKENGENGQSPYIKAVIMVTPSRTTVGLQQNGTDVYTKTVPAGEEEWRGETALHLAATSLSNLLEEAEAFWLQSPRYPAHKEPQKRKPATKTKTEAKTKTKAKRKLEQGLLQLEY